MNINHDMNYVVKDALSVDLIRLSIKGDFSNVQKRGTRVAVCSANNTHVTVYLMVGNEAQKRHSSTGCMGFHGTKRGTPYAAEQLTVAIANIRVKAGVQICDVVLSGTGRGRNVIVKAVVSTGRTIGTISEGTSEPHNGCRPKKARRV